MCPFNNQQNQPQAKRVFFFAVVALFFIVPVMESLQADEAPLQDLTLAQAYQLALQRSESIAIDEQFIKETEGKFYQSLSTALPQVSFGSTQVWKDRSSDNAVRRYTPQSQFTFTQPLFSGFKEFAAIKASRFEHRQRRQELARAKQLLFVDVSDAFYFFKSYREGLDVLKATGGALSKYLVEIQRRAALGRSRASEVASVEARLYQNAAAIEDMNALQVQARQLLEFLVGRMVADIKPQDVILNGPGPLEGYQQKADTRPDVIAASHAAQVSRQKTIVAKAGYWPTVNVMGESYMKRVGDLADSDWNVTLNVSVPIFTSGQTQGNVMQATAQAKEDELRLSRAKRQAKREIADAYAALVSDMARSAAFIKAVEAARKNYDLQVEDYRNNLVNNLDVLQALEDLQGVKASEVSIRNEAQRAYWSFKAATGDLSDDAF